MDNPDGLKLDEWQEWLLRHLLERYPDDHEDPQKAGQLRWSQCLVSVPRQSGKSLIGAILGLWGVAMRQGQTLSLASTGEQALIIYNRVLHTILNNETLKKRFSKTTERRGIVSADGLARYDVKPMKESSLQGIPLDTVLADELHLWKKGAWSAVVLGTSARNGIVIGITTAGDDTSETLIELYKQGHKAIAGDPTLERFGFFVWQAPEGAEVMNPESILASNPAVECGRISLERVMTDLAVIPEQDARRYRLNQFVSGVGASWLPMDLFHKAASNGITERTGSVLGVDVTMDLEWASIAAAKKVGDVIQTELVASVTNFSESRLYDLIVQTYKTNSCTAIAIDATRAPNLAKRLKMNSYPVWQMNRTEISAACAQAFAMFKTEKVHHANDPLLVQQVSSGVPKYVGDTWYLSRQASHGPIDSLYATIVAMYVAGAKEDSSIGVF
jgi:phage terminase large subunit-like protein